MSQSLVSGTYTEDFNYGYPYGVVQPILPQFEYSTSGYSLYTGPVSSTFTRRQDFSLQYRNFAADKNNTDRGVFSGAPTGLTDYYWLWPVMGWNETYVLAINLVMSAPGQLTYYRAFDGAPGDTLTFAVNGKMVWAVSNSSGYNWTQDKIPLPQGQVRMVWTFQSGLWPPSARRGSPPPDPRYNWGTPVPLNRYLRMAQLQITNLASMPVSPQNFGTVVTSDSFSREVGTRTVLSGRMRLQTQSWALNLVKLGQAQLSSTASITTTMRALVTRGVATLNTIDTLTPNSRLTIGLDGSLGVAFELGSTGTATVEVPLNTVQGLLPRNQSVRAITMAAPVIVRGRPVHPQYPSQVSFTSGSAHTWTYADPVSPTSVNHVLPVSGVKYRWVATDVVGANGDPITSWPERSGGPAWTSAGLFCPTVWSHTNYFPEGLKTTTYARTVHFWNRYSQHMWLDLPALPANGIQTWQFVAIMHDPTAVTYNFVMDAGDSLMGATTAYDQQLRDGAPWINLPEPTGSRAMVRQDVSNWAMLANDSTATPVAGKIPYYNKPVVITAIFGGALIPSYLHVIGLGWQGQVAGAPGLSNPQHYLMGRGLRRMGISWSSHMTVMEVAYYQRYLNSSEWFQNAAYLAGVYQFQNYR